MRDEVRGETLGCRTVFEPMPLTWPTFEAIDDTDVSSFSAISQAVLDPPATSRPAVATILLEDPPHSLSVHLHRLSENIIRLIHVGGSDEQLPQLWCPAIVGIIWDWLVLGQSLATPLALRVVERPLTLGCGFWRRRNLIACAGPSSCRRGLRRTYKSRRRTLTTSLSCVMSMHHRLRQCQMIAVPRFHQQRGALIPRRCLLNPLRQGLEQEAQPHKRVLGRVERRH